VRLFLVDGTPGGLVTAEIMNWTGHLIAGPRSDLSSLLRREESHRTGVYLLLGDAPESAGGVRLYVGEGDDISTRLGKHAREKDFWERAVVITSKDSNLTKAHARYLEARLIQISRGARRSELENETSPPLISLPEADVSDMEFFISQASIALPVLGINAFRAPILADVIQPKDDTAHGSEVQFILANRREGWLARAVEVDGEFMVLAGSGARLVHNGNGSYVPLRRRLEADGTIDASGDTAVFTRTQVFASPSAAASVVGGRSANGRTSWVTESGGLTYAAWQNRDLSASD
jgi:hypothetical protein